MIEAIFGFPAVKGPVTNNGCDNEADARCRPVAGIAINSSYMLRLGAAVHAKAGTCEAQLHDDDHSLLAAA